MASYLAQRQSVADMSRYLADHNYFSGTGGNIGVRVDTNVMAVTPSATDYYTIRAEDIVLLDLDTLKVIEGEKTPTIEKGLHARMLRVNRNRHASVHTHQPIASAVALLHATLKWPEGSDLQLLGPQIDLVPYRPSGTGMLAKAFEKALKPGTYAYLLASHGVICAGRDLKEAVDMIRRIDAAAAAHLRDLASTRTTLDRHLKSLVTSVLEHAGKMGEAR